MASDSSKILLTLGLGTAAAVGMWWWLRRKESPKPEDFQKPFAKVAKLCVYPVKSCHRIEVDSIECLIRGFRYDRCWVIVNKEEQFLHQRRIPILAQVQPQLEFPDEGGVVLHMTAPGMPELVVREPSSSASTKLLRVWNMYGEGVDVGDEAAEWISEFLKLDGCRIYHMTPRHKPRVLLTDPRWTNITKPGEETSFADFAPLLITSEASLEVLNSKLKSPVPMERFRPNIILTGCEAYAEDSYEKIRIGKDLIIRGVKPCSRCKITTVDQELGHFTGPEPLQTLRMYRLHEVVYNQTQTDERYGDAPLFGYNYSVLVPGEVSVGDTVYRQ